MKVVPSNGVFWTRIYLFIYILFLGIKNAHKWVICFDGSLDQVNFNTLGSYGGERLFGGMYG
jgi:hypothetical protein